MLDAAKILAREKLNRLVVTDPESKQLIGIISSTDVTFAMLGCGASDDDEEEESDEELAALEAKRMGNMYRKGIY